MCSLGISQGIQIGVTCLVLGNDWKVIFALAALLPTNLMGIFWEMGFKIPHNSRLLNFIFCVWAQSYAYRARVFCKDVFTTNTGEWKTVKDGIFRSFKLALEFKRFLVGSTICLIVRLPFALAGPHYSSLVAGACFAWNKAEAYYYIKCVAAFGIIDAVLD